MTFRNVYMTWLCCLLAACRPDQIEPGLHPIQVAVPVNFPPVEQMADDPMTVEGVALGRKLFYDPVLSGNGNISCASCHRQDLSFSDGLALGGKGFSGRRLPRHAPALINLAWMNNGLFWDGGSTNLESQAFGPLTSPDEMHSDLYTMVEKLRAHPYYLRQFRLVFRDTIRSGYIVRALAQFERTLVSANSRYDKYTRHEAGGALNEMEQKGLALVQTHCRRCHAGELFTDNSFHNNGLDTNFSNDTLEGLYQGRFRITHHPADLGRFKTPTLRNCLLTAPYMHDGRFSSIEQVLDHYSDGILVSATTDSVLARGHQGRPGIALTDAEKKAIISFLSTLNDSSFLLNKQFSSPFN